MKAVFTIYLLVSAIFLFGSDTVRIKTNVDLTEEIFGVNGDNVIVGIMDRGINYEHPGFRNSDGTTRIKYIFDLSDNSGQNEPNNSYGVGTIYTEQDINAALNSGIKLNTRDAVGHGDATAGLVAGNGEGSPDLKYRGMAPNATLIIVKITSDGAPAHGDQAEELPFFDPSLIPVAIDFIVDKSNELGLPCAMILNLGSIGGPSDGSSGLSRKIDDTVGSNKTGLVFITGSGDDGGIANKASGTITQNQRETIEIQKGTQGALFFDLWYPDSDRYTVEIETPSNSYGPYSSPDTNVDSEVVQENQFLYYQLGSSVTFFESQSSNREIWIRFDGPPGNYKIHLTGTSIQQGLYNATINPSQIWNESNSNIFLNNIGEGSIWDGATAFNNICPNSYIGRNQWIDIDGFNRTFTNEGPLNDLWEGSSTDPTFDGRIGIDISAPGDRAVSCYGENSYWATIRGNLINDGNGIYGMAGAVSSAAPITTGIIALMLQIDPSLDAIRVKNILQETAYSDDFTGSTPNARWGYGKIDAFSACRKVYENLDTVPIRPYQLIAEAQDDFIRLNWTNFSNEVDEFLLERSQTSSEFEPIAIIDSEQTTYLDTSNIEENIEYSYRLAARNDWGLSQYSNISSVNIVTTSTNEIDLKGKVDAWPNPIKNYINIKSSIKIDRFQLLDVRGRLIPITSSDSSSIRIFVKKELLPGIYFLRIESDGMFGTIKLISE